MGLLHTWVYYIYGSSYEYHENATKHLHTSPPFTVNGRRARVASSSVHCETEGRSSSRVFVPTEDVRHVMAYKGVDTRKTTTKTTNFTGASHHDGTTKHKESGLPGRHGMPLLAHNPSK